jgi:hypothetical protein
LEFATDGKIHSNVFEDNNGALGLALSPGINPRNNYIGVIYHFIREHNGAEKGIMIHKIKSAEQKADTSMKGLPEATFTAIRKLLTG